MTRSLLVLAALATAATVGVSSSPASAAAAPLEMGVGFSDSYGDFQAEGLTSWNVSVYQDRDGVWRASVFHSVSRYDAATRVFHSTSQQVAALQALPLPAGTVQVSDNGHVVTVTDAVLPIVEVMSTSSSAGATRSETRSTTTLSGTWRLAGGSAELRYPGDTSGFTMNSKYYGCESADHYEDTTRRAAMTMSTLDQSLVVDAGTDKERTAEAALSTYRLRGTDNC